MADFATLRRTNTTGFASRERWHVVVKHEAIAVLTGERVNHLLVLLGAERGNHQRLRFAARKERRAVRAWQHAGADRDRTHGACVATVDAWLAAQNLLANGFRF